MSLSATSIRRPVFTIVLSLLILLFGAIGFSYLPVREFPSIDRPVITVSTAYPGANAEIIESQVTEPLEEVLNGIPGIRSITSTSRDGRSNIQLEFELSVDLETAANDVRDKVSGAVSRLPPDAEPPTVAKADSNSDPIFFVNIQSADRSLLELTDIAYNSFKERLQTVPGVSEIQVWGEKRYSMRLYLNPSRLAAYSLTPLDVRNALVRENVELPSGRVEGSNTELTIRTLGTMSSPEEFNQLIIKESNERVVRFGDIGSVILAPENERTLLRRDGVPMVGNAVIAQAGANTIQVVDDLYKRLDDIKKDLPADIQVKIGFDTTQYIRASISEVQESIWTAFVLVVLIIFLFLRDWRTTIIPVLAIPISLVGTFFVLYLLDYSINVLTLLGVVLAIGLVVDDAIVVLENIYTKIENGMEPMEAGLKGSAEIFFAVIATTITLVAVFMPIIFLEGLTGRLFREFGVTIAASVIISSFVALTLTPMLSTRMLRRHERPNWFYRRSEVFFEWLTDGYDSSLRGFMRYRWAAWLVLPAMFGAMVWLRGELSDEIAPLEDRSDIRVLVTGAEGATFEYMDRFVGQVADMVRGQIPEQSSIITVTAPGFGGGAANTAFTRVILPSPQIRTQTQGQVADSLTKYLRRLTDARISVSQLPTIRTGGRVNFPVQYVIQATSNEKLQEVIPKILAEAGQNPIFTFMDVDLKFTKPEVVIEIDRDKANSLGVSTIDIAQTLQLGISGQRFGYFLMNGKQYQVIGQVDREFRDDPADIRNLYVRSRNGQMIQLDNVVTMRESSAPPSLFRYNRFASATLSANLATGVTIGDGIKAMDDIAAKVLDDTYTTALAGASKDFVESSSSLSFAFMLALVLIYLVLAAQFESFRDPFTIMLTVPMALAGALFSLWYFGQTMNIFSQIGIIMLIGLVTKNAILIVEFANQRKAEGLSRMEAAMEAAKQRFRAILMTALSTVLGILPIALALGAGSESRVSMGIAVVGGMVLSTGLTFYIIPAIYSYVSERTKVVSNVTVEEAVEA